jgi:mono/diheme cytochrome c family protein
MSAEEAASSVARRPENRLTRRRLIPYPERIDTRRPCTGRNPSLALSSPAPRRALHKAGSMMQALLRGSLVGALGLLVLGWSVSAGQTPAKKAEPPLDADHVAKMAKGLDVFKKHVKPVLASRCLKCHGGRSVEGEFDLSDRDSLLKGGQAGAAIVPGKHKDSLLYKLVAHLREPKMPHEASKLPDADIARIAEWIDLGAPYDNPLTTAKAKAKPWTERVVAESAKDFWAFQPLKKLALPRVKNEAWAKTPIDRFVLAKLDEAGLAPSAAASRAVLIRRATFDLIGLPPTPEEVDTFINDTSPTAFEKVVDKLLASPHYGERWGRHWLDLARFAESHGFEHDYDRPTAYHYRDFVIEALNRDVPYDTFVKWQVAGDEYEPANPLAMKATGFLAAGVHSTQITANEAEKHRYDELDDKLSTLTTTFLGLGVGCARCHDHKYDPIPQRDYYRMLATFTTTVRSEVDLTLDSAAYAKAKAAFDAAHAPLAAALAKHEAERLPGNFAKWTAAQKSLDFDWEIVELKEAKSKEGATLVIQPDGSVLATGKNAKFDTYTFVAHTKQVGFSAVRLEALAHPSMTKGGPGRAGNGNFALSDFSVTALAMGVKDAKPVPVKLKNPRITFEQKGLLAAFAIDADAKSAWAIDPQFGKDHAVAFDFEAPVGFAEGTVLTFTLKFNNNDGHNLGRPRLALTSRPQPPLAAPGVAAKVREALQAAKPTPEQVKVALDWYKPLDSEWRSLNQQVIEHQLKAPRPTTVKSLVATEGMPAVRLHTQGADFYPETYFMRRGDTANREGVATQSFLQVLMPAPDAEKRWQTAPPPGAKVSYRRRALAEWLTDTKEGAGQLVARVMVNRVWQHHFGRGIVATPSDFGARGERPTHPELLDWLASEFITGGWSMKGLHKKIMLSAVYQQSSAGDEAKAKIDRDNKLLWRAPTRRLEAEIIRDTLLAASGQLDAKQFGPGTLDDNSKRRSIYFTVKRSKLMPMMVIFDAPEALSGMAERPTTTIAPQALHLMNNPQVRGYARALAKRIAPDDATPLEDAVRNGYRITLSRSPTREELEDSLAFVRSQMATYPENGRRAAALADFCQVLMCLNEFVYVD